VGAGRGLAQHRYREVRMRMVANAVAAAVLLVGAAAPGMAAEYEDELSAKDESLPELLSDGYRVVQFDAMERGKNRIILKKRYNLVYCILEEGSWDEDSLEIESVCYRLR
jgi:hypothetical protein